MPAIELITGQTTAPDTTLTEVSMNTGNSATVRNTKIEDPIILMDIWTKNQTAGIIRLRSPLLHDNVQGIRLQAAADQVLPLLPELAFQQLIPQDKLTIELSGSVTGGDIELVALLLFYNNLPGVDANLITAEELLTKIEHIATIENTIATDTNGDYSGEESIVSDFDVIRANRDYAILGYIVNTRALCVRYRSSDFGNLGIGGPCEPNHPQITSNWFVDLSFRMQLPLIPVFNSANKDNTLIDIVQDEDGADVTVNTIVALLKE